MLSKLSEAIEIVRRNRIEEQEMVNRLFLGQLGANFATSAFLTLFIRALVSKDDED